MAKLSKLSRRLRRCFEVEHPQAAQLDDALLDYFANMLEDEASEDELVEAWSAYVPGDESSTSEMCRAVLKRLRSVGNLSRGSSSSGDGSAVDLPLDDVAGPLARTPSTSSAAREPRKAEVRGLEEWLERLSLRHYAASARSWCAGMGAAHVEEVLESWEEFCDELRLKTLERRRVYKDCVGRGAARPGGGGEAALAPEDAALRSQCFGAAGTCEARCSLPFLWSTTGAFGATQPSNGSGACGRGAVGSSAAACRAGLAQPPAEPAVSAAAAQGGLCRPVEAGQCECGEQSRQLPPGFTPLLARTHRCESFGPPGRQYTILGEIGSGATAQVFKCTRGEEVFAAKAICKSRFRMQRDFAGMMDRVHRETAILFSLRHSHIVSLYDVVDTDDKLYLVMEYVEGGELSNEIISNGALAEHEARYVFLQIVLGLRYIHSKGVVHRDLKPANVLVDRNNSRPGLLEVKISDFGHSKLVDDGYSTALTQVGTPLFWAPEVANSCAAGYDERADLWSLGVVLYLMLEGSYPFSDIRALGELSFKGDSRLSADARDLVQRLLQHRPHDRLPLDHCLRHPWVMTASGPLSRIVELCELREWSRHRQCERRVRLPGAPRDVKQLRRDLQEIIFGYKLPVMLRHHEVSVCFACETAVSEEEELAWEALMQILEHHYPDGGFLRPDRQALEMFRLDSRLMSLSEEDTLVRGESHLSLSSGRDAEELRRHDEFIKAAVKAFPGVVEAVVDHQAARIVDLRLRLGPWRSLELTVMMPAGFPEVSPLHLESISLRCPRKQLSAIEGQLRERIAVHLEGPPLVPGLVELLSWLHEEVLPDLARDSGVAPSARAGGGKAQHAPAEARTDAEAGAVDAPDAGPEPEQPEVSVACGRVCLLTYQHDDKTDRIPPSTAPRGMGSDKLLRCHKNQSFFWHIKHMFPDISGIMSYGKPAVLVAEGPLTVVEKLRSEVGKFTPWWPVQEKVFQTTEPVPDVDEWRAFKNFSKVKSEEVREICEKAGQRSLYELLVAGTSLDPNRDPNRRKTVKRTSDRGGKTPR